jgi:cysteine-rich repeat protein
VGLCHGGTQTCTAGAWGACGGQVVPTAELCDTLDNDCDGSADEDFNFATDLNHCGGCNQSCWAAVPAHAYPSACVGGTCQYSCLTGYADLNGDLGSGGNGCEYTCPVNPPTAEYCDGQDNDCNGLVDDGLTAPVGFCNQGQPGSLCDGVGAVCQDPDGAGPLPHSWYCQYPAGVERDAANPNQLLGYETLCDGIDGDCDGVPDDNFGLGTTCDNGELGACRVTGTVICDAGDLTQTDCDLPPPGTWPLPTDEVCDGVDNDCDNLTDETSYDNNPANDTAGVQGFVVDDVVPVTVGGVTTYVYRYEASRPTATAASGGTGTAVRACSNYDVIPWSFVTFYQAGRACARAGMRLCSAGEWYESCNGTPGTSTYPYGSTYQGSWCNGHDQDPTLDAVEPTGTQTSCDTAGWGTEDMSGNLREWTTDYVGATSGGDPIYRLRGGGYIDLEAGLTCDFESAAYVATVQADHVGFRCCSTCGNGTIDPGETCDPAPPASSPGCHPLHCGPITCGDGILQAGEVCDDGNLLPYDGCSPQCQNEGICGDSIVQGGETCDDGNTTGGDGCSALCQRECGDGAKGWVEQCDDGGTVSGDGCSATCMLEAPLSETEPNGNSGQALANNYFYGSTYVAGQWSPAGDQDYYAIQVPPGGSIHVQTYDANGPVTCATIDTEVFIYDTNGTTQLGYDDDAGPNLCSDELLTGLGGGVYYVRVREYGDNATGNYTVVITVSP